MKTPHIFETKKDGTQMGWTGRDCPACKGTGENEEARRCGACAGTGEEYGVILKKEPSA
jgi:DnaJ-class molecular chaperone